MREDSYPCFRNVELVRDRQEGKGARALFRFGGEARQVFGRARSARMESLDTTLPGRLTERKAVARSSQCAADMLRGNWVERLAR